MSLGSSLANKFVKTFNKVAIMGITAAVASPVMSDYLSDNVPLAVLTDGCALIPNDILGAWPDCTVRYTESGQFLIEQLQASEKQGPETQPSRPQLEQSHPSMPLHLPF